MRFYEPGKPIEEVARELGFDCLDDIIKVASNENALGPSPLALKAIKNSAKNMHRYPDGDAYYLKRALAEKLDVTPSQILPVNGSNEAIVLLAHVFLGPGKGIIMADRAFVVYKLIALSYQSNVTAVVMKDFTHDLDAMLEAITDETRIIFICNPNNPTSTMVDSKAIDRFMKNVPDNVIVCFDEAYIELMPVEKQPDTLKYVRDNNKNVVILRTFSKSYGLAGLRIGYAIAHEDCINLLNRVRQPFNVNAMAMSAAVAALDDDKYVERTRKLVSRGIVYMTAQLKEMGLDYVPPSANFILVKTGKGREVFSALQKEGVIVRPMDIYGLPDYVRITIGTSSENKKTINAMKSVLHK